MNIKILGAVAAVALLAACSTSQTASTGSGAQTAMSGPVPGSEEDLVRNVGDRVFYDFNVATLKPDARARLNTIFMGGMFLGGAAGSAAAATAWKLGGWSGVSALGVGLAVVATALQVGGLVRRRRGRAP